jgi:hypothetical protein
MGWVVNATSRPLNPRVSDHIRIVQQAKWASGPVWAGTEDLTPPIGVRAPDRNYNVYNKSASFPSNTVIYYKIP